MNLPRFYPILDTETLARRDCRLETAARAVIEGGARILQIRHKGHWPRHLFEETEEIARLCRTAGVLLIVNDRADMAMLLGAGLHIGQDDLWPQDARKLLAADAVIGWSTHNTQQLTAAAEQPVDYVALGPIFTTPSKANADPVIGLNQLKPWRHFTGKPLVAVGGITRQNALAVLEAGADSVAVISDLLPQSCTASSLRERLEEWRQLIAA